MTQMIESERCLRLLIQDRHGCTEPTAVTTSRESQIKTLQHRAQNAERLLVQGDLLTQLRQHTLLFISDAPLEIHQPVADVEHGARFDKQGAAGGRAVVNLTRNPTDSAGLHRQHRPTMALRNHRVLQNRSQLPHQLLQFVATLLTPLVPLPA